jgi:hypothetical protein
MAVWCRGRVGCSVAMASAVRKLPPRRGSLMSSRMSCRPSATDASVSVYRDAGSGASWLFKRDGFLHSIPDGGTYRCLTAAGAPVASEDVFQLAELPVSSEPAQCTTPPPPHFARLKRCAIIDEGSAGFHYPVGIYPARNVSCAKSTFVFRRTLHSPDLYVTVTHGLNPWLVWRDGWGCDGHSIWVCLHRFRNPIRGVTRIAYSSECGAPDGCPSRLRLYIAW